MDAVKPGTSEEQVLRAQIIELLKGGFAPNVILLREFDHAKAGVILEGLHFSAWILLGHMHARLQTLLQFMQAPDSGVDVWPDAHWPQNHVPGNRQEWDAAIDQFDKDLETMIQIVQDENIPLLQAQQNGKTISWAAMTALHHNGYHIGQLKTIGRQLGVW